MRVFSNHFVVKKIAKVFLFIFTIIIVLTVAGKYLLCPR